MEHASHGRHAFSQLQYLVCLVQVRHIQLGDHHLKATTMRLSRLLAALYIAGIQ